MSATQVQVDELLAELKTLHAGIQDLRRQMEPLNARLEAVKQDVDRVLGDLLARRSELEGRYEQLGVLLAAAKPERVPPLESSRRQPEARTPPPLIEEPPPGEQEETELPRIDPRVERKRKLANHIVMRIPYDQREKVLAQVNPMVTDPSYDLPDILERVPWGPVWEDKPTWESLDEQLERLQVWHGALQQRHQALEAELKEMEKEAEGWLKDKESRTLAQWQAHLEQRSAELAAEVETKRAAVETREDAWRARQAEGNDV